MAHTEKCRGCMNENKSDYITCRIKEAKEIRNQTIDDCINAFADWFGYDYEKQGYYRLLKQWRDEYGKQ